jgi:8-amino-3,8-dideoxy-alpha-D-manno-octulosonate transaminase
MPVHMLGNPCDMDPIMAIAKKYKLFVIEDCCQAFGSSYKGRRTGTFGDIAAFSLNIFKTITAGDGGAVATNDETLYERAFGFHDQGHKPLRMGVEIGNRGIIGMNMRMNELTGAVSLAQIRKLDMILGKLREKKTKLKNLLGTLPHAAYRKLNDEKGECATLLTLIFDTCERAAKFCEKIDSKPISFSGWHVYNNMEQVLNKVTGKKANCPFDCPKYSCQREYKKHMLPQTDDVLGRAVNISIGVVDKGLGASFGITINSSDEEIKSVASKIKEIVAALC